MADGTAPPGWYPDPHGQAAHRWWDGRTWTGYTSSPDAAPSQAAAQPTPAAQAPSTAAPIGGHAQQHTQPTSSEESAPPKKRGKRVVVIGAIAVGAIAIATGLGFGIPALLGGDSPAAAEPVVVNGYKYEVPMADVAADHTFTFAADYDFAGLAQQLNEAEDDATGIFEVYTDPALTRHAEVHVGQMGDEIQVTPAETEEAIEAASDENAESEIHRIHNDPGEAFFTWGLYETYYLVQYFDEAGEELEQPTVTQFSIEDESQLDPVAANYAAADEAGNIAISWGAVEGATQYLVVTSRWDPEMMVRQYQVAGVTDSTSWSSESAARSFGDDAITIQNAGLDLYETSADSATSGALTGAGDVVPHEVEIGVIATDGTIFSPYLASDASETLGALPHEIALEAADESFPQDTQESLETIPTAVPYTSLDGQTRLGTSHIDPESVDTSIITTRDADGNLSDRDVYTMEVSALGTNLSYPVRIEEVSDVDAVIEEFNTRALQATPKGGAVVLSTADAASAVQEDATPSTSAPETEYSAVGTNELTRYLAANLLDRQVAIDVSAFDGQPGVPDVWDAFDEALAQNPYIVGDVNTEMAGGIVYVAYSMSEDEYRQTQADVNAKAEEVVSSTTSEDMDAAEKVTALNDWIVQNGEYDYEAFELSESGFIGIPEGYEAAWSADGILLDGIGVCASYADALNILVREAGVESVRVAGELAEGGLHAWNKVKIDDRWLAVDSTWNDSDPANGYLLITDEEFTGSATRTEDSRWISDQYLGNYATD